MKSNLDIKVVEGFGDEWSRFDQSTLSQAEHLEMFYEYFDIFPWYTLPKDAVGFDVGCGSGRWAKLVAPRVGKLHCIDPSSAALDVAKKNLSKMSNCEFHLAGVDHLPLENNSADFGYALGVLHHTPDPASGIKICVSKLKQSAPFLLYLYYKFDNRPLWFYLLWQITEPVRFLISRSPYSLRYLLSQIIAIFIYFPLAQGALLLEKLGFNVDSFPLSAYRNRSFYVMRTDALDRFGTKLEKRFTKKEIQKMMEDAGLERISFRNSAPYWCAIGYKK
ncbi:methyltransferase domain-containing protein [Chlorogloeopsis sp. ULAP01]|uniref:class I SAM-dependent methyltransferase n=1 Tax=Chlorogloeopsis sp. ULAP01 TaxID=3056483 RepID=UPI0025AB373C|nr:class I SAM-dependent methyltransferase [Chlorogloeopsis sp. ULAP01]MDM9381278.1 methyltransferase domain-containing protein [Chlorogloeopsis sp. ULAP01]